MSLNLHADSDVKQLRISLHETESQILETALDEYIHNMESLAEEYARQPATRIGFNEKARVATALRKKLLQSLV